MSQEIAWAAGLFEGEGCFSLQRRSTNPGSCNLRAALRMVDEDVVRAFAEIIGVGRVSGPSSKQMWEWKASGEEAEQTYALLGPWLHSRRRARYVELLEQRRAYELSLPAIRSERARKGARTKGLSQTRRAIRDRAVRELRQGIPAIW